MKTIKTSFSALSKNESIRLDFGMRYVDDILNFNPFNISDGNFITIGDVLKEIQSKKKNKGDLDDKYKLIDLANINKRFNRLENVEEVDNISSDKTVLKEGDLIIAKMTPKLGTMFLNLEHNEYIGSTELVEYNIINYDKIALYYILTSNKVLSILGYMESGKNQRRVKSDDIFKIKIPKEKSAINTFIKNKDIELSLYLDKRKDLQKIVDDAFLKCTDIKDIPNNKKLSTSLEFIGDDDFCRMSFHNQNYYKTFEFNKILTDEWCPIEQKFRVSGGKRIPKGMSFSTKPTEYFYLRPKEVSILGINKEEIPFLSEDVYNIIKRYTINTNEYCISNVGTLGKVGLINLEELGIEKDKLLMSENFVKLSPLDKLNYMFYYYFNSYIFKKQVDREYTITSQPKLGLDKIKKMSVPKFNSNKQEEIISYIQDELNEQKEIINKINNLRDELDKQINLFAKI